jgi:cGMP-dependent protein kinase
MGCGSSAAAEKVPLNGGQSGGPAALESIVPESGASTKPSTSLGSVDRSLESSEGALKDSQGGPKGREEKKAKGIKKANSSSIDVGEKGTATSLSPEEKDVVMTVFKSHFMLSKLTEEQRNQLLSVIHRQSTAAEEVLFRQGEAGDHLYIVKSGTFKVFIGEELRRTMDGKSVFGELALIYSQPRTATVVCDQPGELWRIHGGLVRQMLADVAGKYEQATIDFLNQDSTFSLMPDIDKKILASSCEVRTFKSGEAFLKKGKADENVYIIRDGAVYVTDSSGNQRRLKQGGIFGGKFSAQQEVVEARAASFAVVLSLSPTALGRLIAEIESVIAAASHHSSLVTIPWMQSLSNDAQRRVSSSFENRSFEDGETVVTEGAPPELLVIIEGELCQTNGDTLPHGTIIGAEQVYKGVPMPSGLIARGTTRVSRVSLSHLVAVLVEKDVDQSLLAHATVEKLSVVRKTLQDIPLFKQILDKQLTNIALALESRTYADGSVIFSVRDEPDNFYLIMSGRVEVTIPGKGVVRTLAKGDYFGERGLLFSEPRSATCSAADPVEVLQLTSSVFTSILGKFKDVLEDRIKLQDTDVKLGDLTTLWIIGQGSFGSVRLVESKISRARYALKCIRKNHVVETGQQKNVQTERKILLQLFHPCIVQFVRTFKDEDYIYFLMEFLGGGDLFTAIREIGMLTTPQCHFYSGSVILAIDYVHKCRLMYRDLKPENVLLDDQGFVKLVDFGTAKEGLSSYTLVGTPEYLAPEVILGKGYTFAADWWSTGVMMYEFICGPLPFRSRSGDQIELCRAILEADVKFPSYVKDSAARTILKGLLERRVEQRLASGSMGAVDLMEHPYFRTFDWDAVVSRQLAVPYQPDLEKIRAMYVKPGLSDPDPHDRRPSNASSASGFDSTPGVAKDEKKRWDSDF